MVIFRGGTGARLAAALAFLLGVAARQAADPASETLQQARKAAAARDFKTAAQKYQEFLQKAAAHAEAPRARAGLALALLQLPDRNWANIAGLLDPSAEDEKNPDRAAALFWSGTAHREWARNPGGPVDQAALLGRAAKRFDEAARLYGAAAKDGGSGELPSPLESHVLARCGQAEALLAAGRAAEAAAALAPLLREPWIARSRHRINAFYVAGCASYAADDPVAAGRALLRLAPYDAPFMGAHARYLLARIHHAAGEVTEAADHYEAVPALFDQHLQAAKQALQANAPPVKDNPLERARLEAAANGPVPDWVDDALFHGAAVLYGQKKFDQAQIRFARLPQRNAKHPRAAEAQLFAAVCHVQLGRHNDAVGALQPLLAHPTLGARARLWTARAVLRGADPAQAQPYAQALARAADLLSQALDLLSKKTGAAAEALDAAFELGDVLRRAGRAADAVPVYRPLLAGPRGEEALARLVACLQIAGRLKEAEEAFRKFEKEFPRSPFMAEACFHYAECAHAAALAAGDSPEHRPLFEEAVRRFERLIGQYPDLPQANLCRYRLASARYASGRYAEAAAALAAIAEPDRAGPLAASSHVLADALLRSGPASAEARDAVSASRRLQQLQVAAGALQAFLGAQPQAPEAPEVMIKLGFAQQQIAALLQADPQARAQAAQAAVATYEQVRSQFASHPLRAVAEYERANSMVIGGDVAGGLGKLPRFHQEPLSKAPIAPVALLREAQLLRQLNRAPEAVNVMAECRQKYEEELRKDPARASWVPLLRCHHGLALKEAKQDAEAAKVFQSVVQDYPGGEWTRAAQELLQEKKP
jgi:TolA-binding protein